ncbi:hypothetical protein ACFQ0I_17465 [Mariniflexile aquimaris]|uniref:Uncharacterized protein n=1 Tax=Mariniflexile aquimaris TaxID=881009 RepID=A0ABW3BWQ8_9FLAO
MKKYLIILIPIILISLLIWNWTYKGPIKKLNFTESSINDFKKINKLLIDNQTELINKSKKHYVHVKDIHYFSSRHLNEWLPEKSKNTGYLERLGFSPKSTVKLDGDNYIIGEIHFDFNNNRARYELWNSNNSGVMLQQNLYYNYEINELKASEHFLHIEELNENWKYIIEYRKRKDGNTILPTDINETIELRKRVKKN